MASQSLQKPAEPALLSLTFDNLGEAADLERGLWPERKALGEHFSVVEVLPRLLDVLDELGLRATFFVEGLNAELYPEALAEIAAHGHELGLHAWRHEEWAGLGEREEVELLDRGTAALAGLGHRPRGFRPPGGGLTARTAGLLRERGFAYASPAGRAPARTDGLALLPFEWGLVDAWFHFPKAGGLRAQLVGEAPAKNPPLPPAVKSGFFRTAVRLGSIKGARRMRTRMLEAVASLPRAGGHRALLFHPFLLGWEHTLDALRDVLTEAARLAELGQLWAGPMGEAAERVEIEGDAS